MPEKLKHLFLLTLVLLLLVRAAPVSGQEDTENPIYIVQSGDTLTSIAIKFGISLTNLLEANFITDPNALNVGDRLIIPGLEGIKGVLVLNTVPLGENLTGISRKHQLPLDIMTRLNRITSPAEVYAGVELILPEQETEMLQAPILSVNQGQSLLELAAAANLNPWLVKETNRLAGSWDAPYGESLYAKTPEDGTSTGTIGPFITELTVDPLPLIQGTTTTITVKTTQPVTLTGSLAEQTLHFFEVEQGYYTAFAGISALHETGLSEISLKVSTPDGGIYEIQQMIFLSPGLFTNESVVGVDAATIDPEVIMREDETLSKLLVVTPVRQWSGMFRWPVDEPCPSSRFGNRRSYNSGQYFYYHTGLDFTVCAPNLNIYAPAPGTVVFSGPLEIKGNYTLIDHGWGIYTGYAHQSERFVNSGDRVEAGQLIGIIGNTGRSVGPHLHWEVWVNGIPVNPLDWTSKIYPPESD
jgi:murein DD-endopeptidase MepM/ murein hydrolase activator NlpD